jgi:hypothetical protein
MSTTYRRFEVTSCLYASISGRWRFVFLQNVASCLPENRASRPRREWTLYVIRYTFPVSLQQKDGSYWRERLNSSKVSYRVAIGTDVGRVVTKTDSLLTAARYARSNNPAVSFLSSSNIIFAISVYQTYSVFLWPEFLATDRRCIVFPVRYEINLYILCKRK